jgi:hypothetical protein
MNPCFVNRRTKTPIDSDSPESDKKIVACTYSHFGCTFRGDKTALKAHESDPRAIGKHMTMVVRGLYISKLKENTYLIYGCPVQDYGTSARLFAELPGKWLYQHAKSSDSGCIFRTQL